MNFSDFLKYIPKIEKESLLSTEAHILMAPPERADFIRKLSINDKKPRQAAVLMLFYPKNSQTHLVLIVRNSYPGIHSSQIAFPGGKVEPEDISIKHTALRETHEEIGIPSDKIEIVKAFSEVYIPPSNFLVFPFLGFSVDELNFTPDPSEVADIIELSLNDFLNEKNIVIKNMQTSYSENIDVPAFKIQEKFVWGATAMMLSELKETIKKVI